MRKYVFVFQNSEPTMHMDGFDTYTSFSVPAETIDEAIEKLAAYCHRELGWSDDPDQYRYDVDSGDIIVVVPTEINSPTTPQESHVQNHR